VPPVAAVPRSPPFSTSTATATVGLSAGANAAYQACGGVFFGSVPCSAVPVLDAITRSAMLPEPGVSRSDSIIMSRSWSATGMGIAWPRDCGWVCEMTVRSGLVVWAIRCGAIRSPRFAMVAVTQAISNGVTATSRCPMPVWASAAVSGMSPSRDPTTSRPISAPSPVTPSASACLRTTGAPRLIATSANAVLQEKASAWVRVTSPPLPLAQVAPPKLDRVAPPVAGRVMVDSPVTVESGVYPFCSAAAAITILNVDPGG
jgi:hypothetical protein